MTQETTEKIFPIDEEAKLDIKNTRGSVQIKPGKDGEIKIAVIKHLNSGNAEATNIDIRQSKDGSIQAHTKFERLKTSFWKTHNACKVDYIIETPSECMVKGRTISSSVDVSGLEGEFDFKTVSGAINSSDLDGKVKFHSVSGKIYGQKLAEAGLKFA